MYILGPYLIALAFGSIFASDLNDKLKSATLDGDVKSILSLVREGADPNVVLDTKETPLMKLCELGDIPSVVELIQLGAHKNFPSAKHCPMAVAIMAENYDLVKTLVELGCHDHDGKLTQLAICREHVDIAKFMIDETLSNFLRRPYHLVQYNYAEKEWLRVYVDLMLGWGLVKRHNPELVDYTICKALWTVPRKQHFYLGALRSCPESYWEYLRKSGYVHGLTDQDGVSFAMYSMTFWDDVTPPKLLRCEPTDLKHTDKKGNGLVHYAKFGPVFDTLIELGADLDMQNAEGRTPLMEAVRQRDWRVAGMLLRRGANPNIVDNSGNSVLNSDIVQYWMKEIDQAIKP